MENLPILAIMTLFMGAFLNSLLGRRSRKVGNTVVFIAMALALGMMLALIRPVFFEGRTICYWMGGWAPDAGWAYGIGLEVDALSLFFGLIVTIAVMVSGVYSFTYMARDDSQVNFYTLFLMLSGSVLGLVLSGDLFNVYVMVEIMTFSAVAPASISLMISGVLTKCGVYGIIRLTYDLFQNISESTVSYLVTGFGMVTMFICVTMAFNQHNFKRLLAFHSISQVGYVITAVGLGTPLGLSAGLYHAINHTLFKGLLFLVAGAVQHETGSLDLDDLGGLSKNMPRTTALFLIGAASISGLPPFNGFASKWMIYQALFEKAGSTGNFFYILACVVALLTSVLTLASFIKVAQSVFFGQRRAKYADVKECPAAMRLPMWVLAIVCVVLGLFPEQFGNWFLRPAAGAALNAEAYAAQMLGGSTAAAGAAEYTLIGAWQPIVWLLLLVLVCCAMTIVAVSGRRSEPEPLAEPDVEDEQVLPENAKYEPFFSGEESHYSQFGGSALFWGFKENLKKYFSFWHDWHSGIVNDYALYGVLCLAAVLCYCSVFL